MSPPRPIDDLHPERKYKLHVFAVLSHHGWTDRSREFSFGGKNRDQSPPLPELKGMRIGMGRHPKWQTRIISTAFWNCDSWMAKGMQTLYTFGSCIYIAYLYILVIVEYMYVCPVQIGYSKWYISWVSREQFQVFWPIHLLLVILSKQGVWVFEMGESSSRTNIFLASEHPSQ